MKVLLVDDSSSMRTIQRKILEGLGATEFGEAADGVEALRLIDAAPDGFDLILIDWDMPRMDGLTLTSRIRQTDKTTPLIMVATEAGKQRVIEAIKAGVNHYVVKPFTAETLGEKVTQTLEKLKVGNTA